MFEELEKINSRPKPFEFYTADDLWTDEHTSKQMLSYHLNEQVDLSSRNTAFIDRSVDWIASHFNIGPATKIADFGCGPGLYTTRLAKKQADVTGIDFSKNSIQYAKTSAAKQGLNICYTHQNYLDFVTEKKFDLITMIMCDFCALSPTQRSHMLNKFHTLLKPDGSLLLDVYSLAAFDQYQESATYQLNQLNGFWSGNKYYGFLNKFKYEQEKVTLDKYTIVEASRTRTIYNWLQYFTPETLKKEFKNQGLTIEEIYSNVAGSPHTPKTNEFAIIAKTQ
jgi:cyclopropane fatty-acyl-phospholipid synthase-like methyltransferase